MKTIGIIGGMGPMATVDLMQKIIQATDAHEDQEHIHILVDNNTDIPDRTAAILGQGPSPLPELLKSAERLTTQGADFLIMGCNTAHYFLPLMLPELKIPVISMIEATASIGSLIHRIDAINPHSPGYFTVAISSSGCIEFQHRCQQYCTGPD